MVSKQTGNSHILTVLYVPRSLDTLPRLNLKRSLQNKNYHHLYKGGGGWFTQCHPLVNGRAESRCPVLWLPLSTISSTSLSRRPSQGCILISTFRCAGKRRNQSYWFIVALYRHVLIPAKSLETHGRSYSSSNQNGGLLCLSQWWREYDYMAGLFIPQIPFWELSLKLVQSTLRKNLNCTSLGLNWTTGQTGGKAGLGGQPCPRGACQAADPRPAKRTVTRDFTALF